MNIFGILLLVNYILCGLAVLGMIFVEKKKPIRITMWTLVLILIPFLGLFLYILIGYGLNARTKLLLKKSSGLVSNKQQVKMQIKKFKNYNNLNQIEKKHKDLIMLNLKKANALLTNNNSFELLNNSEMFDDLKYELIKAKSSINIMFYIFANDKTGKEIKNILIEKAKQGIKVKVLYDAIGSLFTRKSQFKKLVKAGGEVLEFFPAMLGLKILNFKANYRNHRKIVVIDGNIGYIGGFNIRNDHLGLKKKVSPWSDCNIKVQGDAVHSLQNTFIQDFTIATKKNKKADFEDEVYYPALKNYGKTHMQIVTSAPTLNQQENIEQALIKMIISAKRIIRIETPYFVPNDAFINAIKLALLSGVKVEIIVPGKPDKWFVYSATLSHLEEVLKMGAKVFLYNGFMHSKQVIVDDNVVSIGSSNLDVRSFILNFEINAFIYAKENVSKFISVFETDKQNSSQLKLEYYKKMNIFSKVKLSIARLFSAIL